MMAKDSAAMAFQPGDHASTFGGNSLATAAGTVVVNELVCENNGGLTSEAHGYFTVGDAFSYVVKE